MSYSARMTVVLLLVSLIFSAAAAKLLAEDYLKCMWMFDSDSDEEGFVDERCYRGFWLLPYIDVLPPEYVKALSIWYNNNHTRLHLEICRLNIDRCPEQTLKLVNAYLHDVSCTGRGRVLRTKLVHYLSHESPFYDPTLSPEEASRLDRDFSASRASYLLAASATTTTSIVETPLEPKKDNSAFLARVHVGTNNDDQRDMFVIVDTGSSLLWVHCNPDNGYAPAPVFDPKRSSTFRKEMCNDSASACSPSYRWLTCGDKYCRFKIAYVKGDCSGYLGRETFEFEPLDEVEADRFILHNITFGCATISNLRVDGVLGLNANRVSLISQTGSTRFAYCIGNISDPTYPYNILILDDNNEIGLHGSPTPLVVNNHYYINLEGVTVGGQSVMGFNFRISMLMDLGSTYTLLSMSLLKKLEAAVADVIGGNLTRTYSIKFDKAYTLLCYVGFVGRDLAGFPVVEFNFYGGAVLELSAENMFKDNGDGNFCLTAAPSEQYNFDFALLGNYMQQYFYIAFDLKENELSFLKMDCDILHQD
ncbi:eukaryotic aspartyl protease family protein [Striga asiatica]|uniref:Eukaryotic aspartyl protease family protein n=1 Tax=Striga asiatica TaxID=4170 RepID=A0A5A7RJM1_STRAF|nr:eukaryotic aspartyl protease family protein [Striga asiatica]